MEKKIELKGFPEVFKEDVRFTDTYGREHVNKADGEILCPFCEASGNQVVNVENYLDKSEASHTKITFACGDGCIWNMDIRVPSYGDHSGDTTVKTEVTSTSPRHWRDQVENLENSEYEEDENMIEHYRQMLQKAEEYPSAGETWNYVTDHEDNYQGTIYRREDGMSFVRREGESEFIPCHEDCGYHYLAGGQHQDPADDSSEVPDVETLCHYESTQDGSYSGSIYTIDDEFYVRIPGQKGIKGPFYDDDIASMYLSEMMHPEGDKELAAKWLSEPRLAE